MSIFGTVRVSEGKYRINGDFHHVTPNMPIRNEDEGWRLMGVTNTREMVYIHMYGGEAIFFENLAKGKIYGTKCENQDCKFKGTVYVPFRIHCPDCLGKNEIIDLTDEDVMYPLRQELGIGVVTAGETPAGILAKCRIAELLEIEINSVHLFKSMINR